MAAVSSISLGAVSSSSLSSSSSVTPTRIGSRQIPVALSGIPEHLHSSIESVWVRNTENFQEATLVLVSDENHFDMAKQRNIRRFLNTCPGRGDVFLGEGLERGQQPLYPFYPWTDPAKGVTEQGWDDMALHAFACEYLDARGYYQRISETFKSQTVIRDELLKQTKCKLQLVRELSTEGEKDPQKTASNFVQSTMLEKEVDLLSAKIREIDASQAGCQLELEAGKERWYRDAIVGRNRSMIDAWKTSQKVISQDGKIYILAGAAHFEDDPELIRAFINEKVMLITFNSSANEPGNKPGCCERLLRSVRTGSKLAWNNKGKIALSAAATFFGGWSIGLATLAANTLASKLLNNFPILPY